MIHIIDARRAIATVAALILAGCSSSSGPGFATDPPSTDDAGHAIDAGGQDADPSDAVSAADVDSPEASESPDAPTSDACYQLVCQDPSQACQTCGGAVTCTPCGSSATCVSGACQACGGLGGTCAHQTDCCPGAGLSCDTISNTCKPCLATGVAAGDVCDLCCSGGCTNGVCN